MNKILKLLAAVTLIALTTAACQKEKLFDSQTEGEETVTFTVQTDAATTKASVDGDGLGADLNRCLVAVYMKTGDPAQPFKLYDTPATTGSGLNYTFTVNLIRKQTYQIVVWADKGETVYDVNEGLTLVKRKTGDVACNSDAYDAFYASIEFVQGTTTSTAITAKRPFAQLNLITKDLNKNFQPGAVSVTYSSPQSFNPFDGTVSADMTEVTYKADSPYYNTATVTTATQHTLVMNYLFAAEGDQTILPSVKMTAKLTVDAEIEVANVPVRRNYRTNIIGNLLTEQTDYTITVDPAWSTPESNYIFVAPGVCQFVDNEYEIYAKEGLDWLAKTVNGGNTLSGKTVKLAADLDMTGIDYVPAGNTIAAYPSRTFAGVFDGQGHTISNLSVASHTGAYSAAGLFGTITGTVKNVKLANVNITSDHYAGGVVGYISDNTGASVQNCSVEGGSIKSTAHLQAGSTTDYDDGDKAGGIVGYITAVDYIDGCSVKNLTITAYRDLGAIVGCAAGSGTVKVTNCTVGDNVLVVVDNSHNYKNYTTNEAHNAGNYVGRKATSVDETGSTGTAQIVYPEANAVATVNGTSYATLAEAVAAVTDGSTVMILEPQVLSSTTASLQFGAGKSVTVMGAGEGSVIDASAKTSSVACTGDITFVNMTFKFNQGSTQHYNIGLFNGGGTHVYENCKFEGQTVAWGNTTYNNCEFTSTVKYAAWVYSGTVVYNNCKFSAVDRAVKVFDEGPALDVTYNNCTFSCQNTNKAAVEVDVTNNTTNLVKVAINNPVLEGTFGNAEHWGTQYFNLEGGAGCNGVVTIDGKTYAKVATNNAFDVAVNETAKEINVRMTGPCGITTSDYYNKLGGPETTVINIDGNGNALTVNSTYRNHVWTDNNAKIVLKNVTMDSNYKVGGSTWDDYGLIFDCPTEFTDVTFNRQLVLSRPYKHILNNVTINQTAATGDMYALWIQAGADVTFNGGTVNSINPNSGSLNRAIKIADEYMPTPLQLTKLNVSRVTFKSQKKAAVLVTSTAGADIIWGEGNDISNVAADQTNAVWNDAGRTAAWKLITVTGCTKYQEK